MHFTSNISKFSQALTSDIRESLAVVEREDISLDAYRLAASIQRRNPFDNVALEDIVDAIIRHAVGIRAIELQPPGDMEVAMIGEAAQAAEAN